MTMEQARAFLLIGLCMVSFLLWQEWQKDYVSSKAAPTATTTGAAEVSRPDMPSAPPSTGDTPPAVSSLPTEKSAADTANLIRVRTDVLEVLIDPRGGNIVRVDLLQYPVSLEKLDTPFRLLDLEPAGLFIAQSGLLAGDRGPNHHAVLGSTKTDYVLATGADDLAVPLSWQGADGVKVTKTLRFKRNSYLVDVEYNIDNASASEWSGRMYGQLQRVRVEMERGLGAIYTYTGGVISTDEKRYEKVDFDDMEKKDLDLASKGGWIAMIQHYFAGAWIPEVGVANHFYSKALSGQRFVLGVLSPESTVASGASRTIHLKSYIGPKDQDRLEQAGEALELTVDYGVLTIIAQPLFWLLKYIQGIVVNWGWSIVVLTMLIKLAFFHLSAASYKSMARMRKVQPRLVTIRERYAGDKARINQAMMELYKQEKINPMGGCLPILVQIPVFIALYWVLLESVELRQAEFIFWFHDLSVHDPYFVLPILMGVSMFIQQRLNPAPPDPIQAKVMMALPFVFTLFFLFFPSGLVLYWLVNNVLSIIQQWVITKRIVGDQS